MTKNKPQNIKNSITAKKRFPDRALTAILLTAVVLITFIIYYSNLTDHFVDFDDNRSVCENPVVLSPPTADGIKTIFTTFSPDGNYDPLVRLSYMIDYSLYGFTKTYAATPIPNGNSQLATDIFNISRPDYVGATGYHITSLILHCISVILLFFFCYQLSRSVWIGAIVALLFGIHPMHVESVAWISERKDQLYVLFYFAAMLTYLKNLRQQKISWLLWTGLFFLLSLFSKGEAVTLPIVLMLIDYYEGKKINWSSSIIKIPFFITSIVFGIVAVLAEKSIGSIENPDVAFPFFDRILFACYALVMYVWKLIVPVGLSAFYPYPVKAGGTYPLMVYVSPLIVLAMLALLWWFRKNKTVVFGGLFFLVNIILLIQLIPVGDALVAERYTYLPYTGLFFIAAALPVNYFQYKNAIDRFRPVITAILGIYFIFLTVICYAQAGVWQNSKMLWQNAYKTYPATERVCGNLSEVYLSEFKIDTALYYLNEAVNLNSTQAYIVRSSVYTAIGKYDLAFNDCGYALKHHKSSDSLKLFDVYLNRAHIYALRNQPDSALNDCNSALAIKGTIGNKWSAYEDRGIVLMSLNRLDSAIADFRNSLQGNPNPASIYEGIGSIYNTETMPDSAIINLNKVLSINPNSPQAIYQLAIAYQQKGDYSQAFSSLTEAKQLGIKVDDKMLSDLQQKANSK